MLSRKLYLLLGLFIALMGIASELVLSTPPATISSELEKAILAEEWKTEVCKSVAENCGSNADLASSSILRAIKGHALLALNRNNESLELFLSITSDAAKEEWRAWVTGFAEKYHDKAISHYFKGDAFARLEEWERALEAFNQALKLHPNWFLALNARGIVQHALGNLDQARSDFSLAIQAKSDFADAYASWGTLNVHGSSAEGALKHFQNALHYSPDFVLAINGRGCASFGYQKFDEAENDFRAVSANSAASTLAEYNFLASQLARLDKTFEKTDDAGMNLEVFRMERDQLAQNLQSYLHGRDKGGRLPKPGPPDRSPKPGPTPKPGAVPGGPEQPKPGTIWPPPPVWVPVPGIWGPPYPDPDNPTPEMPIPQQRYTNDIEKIRELNNKLERTLIQPSDKPLILPAPDEKAGGAETKSIKYARKNKGGWLVCNWYGLGYSVAPKWTSGGEK